MAVDIYFWGFKKLLNELLNFSRDQKLSTSVKVMEKHDNQADNDKISSRDLRGILWR